MNISVSSTKTLKVYANERQNVARYDTSVICGIYRSSLDCRFYLLAECNMNERIKELAVQADLLIKKTNGDEFRYGNFDPKFQKFAELIVRECVEVVKWTPSMFPNDEYVKNIKQHFGVEE